MRLDKKDKAQALIKEIRTFNTASPFKSLTLVYQLLIDKNDEAALIQLDTVTAGQQDSSGKGVSNLSGQTNSTPLPGKWLTVPSSAAWQNLNLSPTESG